VFLSALGLGSNLVARATLTSATPAHVTAPSETHMYCDGGDNENWMPANDAGTVIAGDPIRKDCLPDDDLCNCDGKMGVVRAVRSPIVTGTPPVLLDQNYPPYQCTRGKFATVSGYNSTSHFVCPDGRKPSASGCLLPYFNDTSTTPPTKHFNCINDFGSKTVQAPSCDGRQYNFVMRSDTGVINFKSGNLPNGGLMRHNVRKLDVTVPIPGGLWTGSTPKECEEEDATKNIGCLVSKTTCTIGFAGRLAAATDPYDNKQEPFAINGVTPNDTDITNFVYPFARDLYLSALGGFENIKADCESRNGGPSAFCNDEVAIAQAFYDMSPEAQTACGNFGFVPRAANSSLCVGAETSAGCGQPDAPALGRAECDPTP
jgi:hypothetical protein